MQLDMMSRQDLHIFRKTVHVALGLLGLVLYYLTNFNSYETELGVLAFGITALIFDIVRLRSEKINTRVVSLLYPLMRKGERFSLTSVPFYILGVAVSLILYHEPFAILSILFLVIVDPVASAVGVVFGTTKIHGNKTLEGSLAGFVAAFGIVMIYGLMYFPVNIGLFIFALLCAMGCTLVELFSTRVDHNLTVPILSGAFMSFIDLIIPMV